jgi:hypothetical protein
MLIIVIRSPFSVLIYAAMHGAENLMEIDAVGLS